jgi:biotin transport system substrate-specific component
MSLNINVAENQKLISKIISSDIFWIFSFTFLTAISAQISFPVKPVPFTMQTMMVALAGAFLGAKKGAYSQLLYLGLGVIGLPVFAPTPDGYFGFAALFGPTGGYLLAFPVAAFTAGFIVEKNKSYFAVISAMVVTEFIIILSGTLYLNFAFLHDWTETLKAGAIIFSVWTVVKVFVGASIYSGVFRLQRK